MLLSPEGKTGGTRHIFVPAEKKIPKIRDIVMRFPPDNMDMTLTGYSCVLLVIPRQYHLNDITST